MRFAMGDHLRVWRPLWWPMGYYHHGIYIGHDRVVQFGGSVFDKRYALGLGTAALVRRGVLQGSDL